MHSSLFNGVKIGALWFFHPSSAAPFWALIYRWRTSLTGVEWVLGYISIWIIIWLNILLINQSVPVASHIDTKHNMRLILDGWGQKSKAASFPQSIYSSSTLGRIFASHPGRAVICSDLWTIAVALPKHSQVDFFLQCEPESVVLSLSVFHILFSGFSLPDWVQSCSASAICLCTPCPVSL